MDVLKTILTALIGALGGGGILGFIQFLINRSDGKRDEMKEIKEGIQLLAKKDDVDILAKQVKEIKRQLDEREATNARVRILRFSDELTQNMWHSKDSFDQAVLDCDAYEDYCSAHPAYKNSIAGAAIEYIRKTYQKCIEEHAFNC